jgi:polyprenyl-phospho-N-acetylgalactosaminyl synthase
MSEPDLPGLAKKTAIVIPAYNEGAVLEEVLRHVLQTFPTVICINDGSKDNTAQAIANTKAVLINHPINMGQGAALQTGIEYALSLPHIEYIVTFDADGQHRVEDVLFMLSLAAKNDVDVVLGSRFLTGETKISTLKKVILKTVVLLNRLSGGLKLTDAHNGLRLFTRAGAQQIDITLADMAHASEIISIIKHKKMKYIEAPVTIDYTEYSKSKGQPMINSVNIASDIFMRRFNR